MRYILRFVTLILVLQTGMNVQGQTPAKNSEITKLVKSFVLNIRANKPEQFFNSIDLDAVGYFLLADNWSKGTAAQRKEFIDLLKYIFIARAFPGIHTNFSKAASISYGQPQVTNDQATITSTMVILHPTKNQEKKIGYALIKTTKGWRVYDCQVVGSLSMLTAIRDEQLNILMREGGWDALLKRMRELKNEAGR